MVKTIHYCSQCDYKSTRRWDRDRHVRIIHEMCSNRIPIIENKTSNVQQNVSQAHEIGFNITQYPTEDYNVNNIQNQDNYIENSTKDEDTPKAEAKDGGRRFN